MLRLLKRIEWGQVCEARLGKETGRTAGKIREVSRQTVDDLEGQKDISFFPLCEMESSQSTMKIRGWDLTF